MRRILVLFTAVLFSVAVIAQQTQKMSYQAVIRDAINNLVQEKEIDMRISILQGLPESPAVYEETITASTNINGLVVLEIGGGTGFSDINWAEGPYFIEIQTDLVGDGNFTLTTSSQLLSVPFAFHANTAGNKPGSISDMEMDADSRVISRLSGPVDQQDAARKAYVDMLAGQLDDRIKALENGIAYIERNVSYGDGVTDQDGNLYQTVVIGQQEWMAENLKTTKYNDGTDIQNITDDGNWNLGTAAYTWYGNNYSKYGEVYGALYNWHAVGTNKICPAGWEVPSDNDWSILSSFPGNQTTVGQKLKSVDEWYTGEPGMDNYGFAALPGGARNGEGSFGKIRSIGSWWSSSETNEQNASVRKLSFDLNSIEINNESKNYGMSVRCIKETEGYLPVMSYTNITEIASASVKGASSISNDWGLPVLACGFVWGRSQNPTLDNNEGMTSESEAEGIFSGYLTDLSPGAQYTVRSYATNSMGTSYSANRIFTTTGNPAISNVSVYNLTKTSFSLRGQINDDEGRPVISKGFVWSRSIDPNIDINDGMSDNGNGTGSFTSDVSELEPGTSYNIRAYATKNLGIRYGNMKQITLKDDAYYSEASADSINDYSYKISGGGRYSEVTWGASLHNWTYGSVASDDAYKGSEIGDQVFLNEIELWDVTAMNNYPAEKWKLTLEMGVPAVNDLLVVLNQSDEIFSDTKKQLKAEAHFFRGFFNFEAWIVFKNIPILTEDTSDPGLVSNDNPEGAVLQHIISDLQYAWENLPETQSDLKRPTKYAAMALAAKAYMQVLDYASAKPLLDNIINSTRFELTPNFFDNYRISNRFNEESIFEIEAIVNDINQSLNAEMGIGINYPHGSDIGTCCGFHQPSQNLVNSYRVDSNGHPMFDTFNNTDLKNDQGIASSSTFVPFSDMVDPRLDWTVSRRGIPYRDWGINRGRDWIRNQAFGGPYLPVSKPFFDKSERYTHSTTTGWMSGVNSNNFRYLRYAHVLLWRAEVAAFEGDLATSVDLVNQIRLRAGNQVVMGKVLIHELSPSVYPWGGASAVDWTLPAANYKVSPYIAFTSPAEAMRAVQWELRLEFATEGLRFFDLRRWDNLPAHLNSVPMVETLNSFANNDLRVRTVMMYATFTERDKYQPIPQKYIDINPNLIQNPGY